MLLRVKSHPWDFLSFIYSNTRISLLHLTKRFECKVYLSARFWLVRVSGYFRDHSRHAICLEEAGTTSESISVGSVLLAVAGLAVHIVVGAVASQDGVELLGAVTALEALAMPLLNKAIQQALISETFAVLSTKNQAPLHNLKATFSTSCVPPWFNHEDEWYTTA